MLPASYKLYSYAICACVLQAYMRQTIIHTMEYLCRYFKLLQITSNLINYHKCHTISYMYLQAVQNTNKTNILYVK